MAHQDDSVQAEAIYISHIHNDFPFVRELERYLERHRIPVWTDFDDIPRDAELRNREHWGDAVLHGLDRCEQMVLVLSPTAMHSRRVRAEWRYFYLRNKRIIPILIEGAEVGPDDELNALHDAVVDLRGKSQEAIFESVLREVTTPYARIATPQVKDECEQDEIKTTIRLLRPRHLHPKSSFLSTSAMINLTREQLWVSGITIDRILNSENRPHLTAFLRRGGQLKLLFTSLKGDDVVTQIGPIVQDVGLYVGGSQGDVWGRLSASENNLLRWLNAYPNQITVKRLPHRPSMGYFISDPHMDTGVMTASPYFYQIDLRVLEDPDCEAPFLYFERRFDSMWFEIFKADFETMWNHGRTQAWTGEDL